MAEITLADYAGHILVEVVRAREMADAYSRELARRYGEDEVLQHFSVPRFKVPKLALTIPVLVAGARFQQVLRLQLELPEFNQLLETRLRELIRRVQLLRNSPFELKPANPQALARLADPITVFYKALLDNPEPASHEPVVAQHWPALFKAALDSEDLWALYVKHNPEHALYTQSQAELLALLRARTVAVRTRIENLLVNPETQQVKEGSSDSSVFTIQADLEEDGFFIRRVRDESGNTTTVVEFD